MPKLNVIQGGATEQQVAARRMVQMPDGSIRDPRQHNEHMVAYYKATASFEKFFATIKR